MRFLITAASLIACILTVGCVSTETSESGRSEPGGARATAADPGPSALPEVTQPETPSKGDFRVIFYQQRGGVNFILVNRGHSLRKSAEGRRRLALYAPGLGYKVLAEPDMEALLVSLEDRNYSRLATPFQAGDEQFFDRERAGPRYRGMVFVERNGTKQKVLGWAPANDRDGMGARRLATFVELKLVCLKWFRGTSATEVPDGGNILRSPRR